MAGGDGVSVGQPRWCRDGSLVFVDDRRAGGCPTGWTAEDLVGRRARPTAWSTDGRVPRPRLGGRPGDHGRTARRLAWSAGCTRSGRDQLVRLRPPGPAETGQAHPGRCRGHRPAVRDHHRAGRPRSRRRAGRSWGASPGPDVCRARIHAAPRPIWSPRWPGRRARAPPTLRPSPAPWLRRGDVSAARAIRRPGGRPARCPGLFYARRPASTWSSGRSAGPAPAGGVLPRGSDLVGRGRVRPAWSSSSPAGDWPWPPSTTGAAAVTGGPTGARSTGCGARPTSTTAWPSPSPWPRPGWWTAAGWPSGGPAPVGSPPSAPSSGPARSPGRRPGTA